MFCKHHKTAYPHNLLITQSYGCSHLHSVIRSIRRYDHRIVYQILEIFESCQHHSAILENHFLHCVVVPEILGTLSRRFPLILSKLFDFIVELFGDLSQCNYVFTEEIVSQSVLLLVFVRLSTNFHHQPIIL